MTKINAFLFNHLIYVEHLHFKQDLTLFEDIEQNGWQLRDRNYDNPDDTTLLNCVFSKTYCDTRVRRYLLLSRFAITERWPEQAKGNVC